MVVSMSEGREGDDGGGGERRELGGEEGNERGKKVRTERRGRESIRCRGTTSMLSFSHRNAISAGVNPGGSGRAIAISQEYPPYPNSLSLIKSS
jgi:hypothetical protein